VSIDVGTGDGQAVLRRASAAPGTLVIGLDAVAEAMADASRRAARAARKGGPANACFVVAAAERLPPELRGLANEVTVQFPWGSLLLGMLRQPETPQPRPEADASPIATELVGLLQPGGRLEVLIAMHERDRVGATTAEAPSLIQATFERAGLKTIEAYPIGLAEVRRSGSSWARRLGAGTAERPAWRLRFGRSTGRPRG